MQALVVKIKKKQNSLSDYVCLIFINLTMPFFKTRILLAINAIRNMSELKRCHIMYSQSSSNRGGV